jgi:plastocyanin
METTERDIEELSEGDLLVFDGELCLVSSTATSSGGKHGSGKVTVEMTVLPDGPTRKMNQPEDSRVEVPEVSSASNPIVSISAGEKQFDPAVVEIATGESVVWLWEDTEPHRLAAESAALSSERVTGVGQTFEHTFREAGTHVVRCPVHDHCCVVVVED